MTTIPDDIRRFVLTSIPSVPYLEAALLLRGEERGWTVTEVARRLYITDAAADELLEALQAGGLAQTVAGPAPGFSPAVAGRGPLPPQRRWWRRRSGPR